MKTDLLNVIAKAMDNAREGITISDALLADNPLIYVNKGFVSMTGYTYEDIIGKNCRYLQGAETNPADIKNIRQALNEKNTVQVELLNYRNNGDPFWNYLSISPVFNGQGVLTNFIGVQDDVTMKKEMELIKEKNNRQQLIQEITIQASEKERKELGIELHDNINQILATGKLYLNMAIKEEEIRIPMITKSQSLIDEAIAEIRLLSKKLVGPKLDELSLDASIDELVSNINIVAPFSINYKGGNINEDQLSANKKLMLYRIVQEQLNNTIKHAKAKNVIVNLTEKDRKIQLQIKDDGIGFDTGKNMEGIGLKNIKSRLGLENGLLHINSSPGKGCDMIITLNF